MISHTWPNTISKILYLARESDHTTRKALNNIAKKYGFNEKGSRNYVPKSVPGLTCMANILCLPTGNSYSYLEMGEQVIVYAVSELEALTTAGTVTVQVSVLP